jgi:preprotein translocase SecE subunit
MATAVEQGSTPQAPTSLSLPFTSLLGAIYVVAVVAIFLYAFPVFWSGIIGSEIVFNTMVDFVVRQVPRLFVAVGLLFAGRKLLGDAPPHGVRAGIFLILAAAIVVFFIWRFFAMTFSGMAGMVFSTAIGAALAFFTVRFFARKKGEGWMVALEEQGWFHTAPYKRILGQRVRRLTILGLLLLGGTGIYSLYVRGSLPETWTLSMPFEMESIRLLPDARIAIPFILVVFLLWFAYRAVNVPTFAEFLLATEAEMNKVSWTPRKRLFQDTVVVLTTTLLMALFLLVVDLFWGWLLSNSWVGVLPQRAPASEKAKGEQARW